MTLTKIYKLNRCLACGLLLAASFAVASPDTSKNVERIEQFPMDQVRWNYSGDHFRCELELPLQKYGVLRFEHNAGDALALRYSASGKRPEHVGVGAVTAPWVADIRSKSIPLQRRQTDFAMDTASTGALMQALDGGFWLSLAIDDLNLRIPTVRWGDIAEAFRNCREKLSPLSISQARDQALFYENGQRALNETQLQHIAQLARYIALDPQVTKLLVDGYTDNTGSRIGNLQISRERAADVAAALRSAGVPANMIEQRAHGDRYPSASNATAEGRNLNRKVTIRVIRQETEETS